MNEPMRAITVQQPWAWAIAERHKPIENRGQNVTYRGEVAIHAGLKLSDAPIPNLGVRALLAARGGTDACWRPSIGETGRPTLALRAALTGVSAMIKPAGKQRSDGTSFPRGTLGRYPPRDGDIPMPVWPI